jgi:hypothetical protein
MGAATLDLGVRIVGIHQFLSKYVASAFLPLVVPPFLPCFLLVLAPSSDG